MMVVMTKMGVIKIRDRVILVAMVIRFFFSNGEQTVGLSNFVLAVILRNYAFRNEVDQRNV